MKRAGTSAYALKLPQFRGGQRSTQVVEISGRQRIARRGIYFAAIGKYRRAVYQQFDGSMELADRCSCITEWRPDFSVTRSPGCVIDQHRRQAFDREFTE